MPTPAELEPYLTHLRALPFVRGAKVVAHQPKDDLRADYRLVLRTQEGEHRLFIELKKTHVTREVVERLANAAFAGKQVLFAPSIGRELGDLLEQRKVGFVDRAGNCYLNLSGRHVARIQGKRAEPRAASEKSMRAPAYRALFALLADPKLADASVRTLADAASVSRQATVDIRRRLQALGILHEKRSGFAWTPRGTTRAIDLFLVGYATALRPLLVHGRFRTRAKNPEELERTVTAALPGIEHARWGGGAACMRMTGHYRGERTILHLNEAPHAFIRTIAAVPDHNGPLELLRFPGPLGSQGATADTAHPLLVYAELLMERSERAREAATEILERWMPQENGQ